MRRAELLHCANVGLVIDGARRDAVPAPVAWQKEQRGRIDLAPHDDIARKSVRRVDLDFLGWEEPGQRIETAPPDDPQGRHPTCPNRRSRSAMAAFRARRARSATTMASSLRCAWSRSSLT